MSYFPDHPDLVEPISPTADGPPPTLVRCTSSQREIELVVNQASLASKSQSVAILFRDREDEQLVARNLPTGSIRLHRDMQIWQSGPGVWYGTYYSAKGLEFDLVILPFLTKDRLPAQKDVQTFGEEDAAIQYGRLLYVGVTRAKTRLILTYTGEVTRLLPASPDLYQTIIR